MLQAGNTPLFLASLRGHTEVVKLLLENGAKIGICDEVCMFITELRTSYYSPFLYRMVIVPSMLLVRKDTLM